MPTDISAQGVDLEARTKRFAMSVIHCVSSLPKSVVGDVLGRQLLRSATSVGANYREARRAESRNDFVHKIGIAAKEAAESEYWLELLIESRAADAQSFSGLLDEANQLLRILVSSGKTARSSHG